MLRHVRRDIHYLHVEDLSPLADVQATYWLFQTGVEQEEIEALRKILPRVRIIEGLDLRDDFEGQAGFLAHMDAVVAPCNVVAELAGALGVSTLFFGRTKGANWRLKPGGQDIWHKSVRSVVGSPLGDRQATAAALAEELAKLCSPKYGRLDS